MTVDTNLIVTIVGGFFTLVATIITVVASANASQRKMNEAIKVSQAVTDTKIEELTREVREHNDFARRVPVIEEQNRAMESRMNKVEGVLYGGKAS